MKTVPSDVLHGLNELKVLRLNGNTITKIETGAFRDMPSLKEIQVSSTLKLSLKDPQRLAEID